MTTEKTPTTDADVKAPEKEKNGKIKAGTTKGGKQIEMVRTTEGLWKVQFLGGGQIPKELDGVWNNSRQLQAAIDVYQLGK